MPEGCGVQGDMQPAAAPCRHQALQVLAVQVRVVQQEETCSRAAPRLATTAARGLSYVMARD